ncbi:class I SAM-dependent methyltransferase [Pseudomonas sp. Leaf58]|uniref:class I SAM-dependent methyltransferase n=1 Tax=Pseudomonas TaxID=286 RepID=UPI000701AF3C|nr:class I SAM-dependent methyltransferase [Pseudomonas sp. Leaf58]AYG46028.1 class I SAM-dependent methyltransferase [Pseudomonas sp. Leaf58]KQN59687.1 SAM-dependent methyltransferase [Pseudomonas sp. Leaf58]
MSTNILQDVADYYSSRIRAHGATPEGVDWNGSASQQLRFAQLLKLVPVNEQQEGFSLIDVGCGYGALLAWLQARGVTVDYHGYDVSEQMIAAARQQHPASATVCFEVAESASRQADYAVASGIFNVCQATPRATWEAYIADVLRTMDACSRKGFAFNCLTSYSDPPFMRDYLYYGDPCFYFDLCKTTYSREVALLHDYGLYEFTLLVRKAS